MNGTQSSLLKYMSLVSFIISGIISVILSSKWRIVWGWFPIIGQMTFPDLNGTWEGHLVTTWIDPITGETKPALSIKIWVRQGIFVTKITLKTTESISYYTRCLLEADREAGLYRFWYSYSNSPKAGYTYRSAKHDGVAWLELDTDPNCLEGNYYTDRKKSGDILVKRIKNSIE
jgi:SMODS-associating 2TM, beta-strand rich effector domain